MLPSVTTKIQGQAIGAGLWGSADLDAEEHAKFRPPCRINYRFRCYGAHPSRPIHQATLAISRAGPAKPSDHPGYSSRRLITDRHKLHRLLDRYNGQKSGPFHQVH